MKDYYSKHKKNKINIVSLAVILFIAIFLVACSQNTEDSDEKKSEKSENYLYYIDKNETKIIGEAYKPVSTERDDLVKEYLEALSSDPKDYSLKKVMPDNLKVEAFKFNEDNGLGIYFNSDYNNLTGISEVLCRASIVKTLCQIDGVDDVAFYVGGQPLKGLNDQPISFMKAADFIDDSSAENVYVTVYFSNEDGTALVGTDLKITYDGNVSMEKLILDSLISGPKAIKNMEDNMLKTVPDGTELLNVSTKDGICYIDFNDKFLDKIDGIKDEVVIYSIVNSLDELSTINKVQFTIDGAVKKNYREGIAFDGLFERNLELVEGSK